MTKAKTEETKVLTFKEKLENHSRHLNEEIKRKSNELEEVKAALNRLIGALDMNNSALEEYLKEINPKE